MPRPKAGYALPDGTKVPGVTTILNRFKDSGGLSYWAWQQGRDGKDFREEKQAAADAGSLAHALVEATLRGEPLDALLAGAPEAIRPLAVQGWENWQQWRAQTRMEIIPWEKPLVCTCYAFGGTPDAILQSGDDYALGDWKTGNAIYVETLLQLAAYQHLLNQHAGLPYRILGGFHIGRFSKEHGDFSHHYFKELDGAWQMFVRLREAYDLDKLLKGRV